MPEKGPETPPPFTISPPQGPKEPEAPKRPEPFSGTPRKVVIENWKGVRVQELIIFMGRGLTQEETEIAMRAGVDFGAPQGTPTEPAVDRSGLDLGSGGGNVKVNGVVGGEFYPFTFDVRDGQTAAEIDVFGSPGKFFYEVTTYVTSPGGFLIVPTHSSNVIGMNHKELFTVPGPGKYTIYIKVDKSGMLGVQYNQR